MLTNLFINVDSENPVLVIGVASLDIVGVLASDLEEGTSTPAKIRHSFGGTARNFAENLARLGQPVTLLSSLGKDQFGRQMLKHTEQAGVNIEHIIHTKDQSTGSYIAVINPSGELQYALDDMGAVSQITPRYLEEKKALFKDASMLFIDANLPEKTLETAFELALQADLPIAADPTSASLTKKLQPYLEHINLITPNHKEAGILCSCEIADSSHAQGLEAAQHLVSSGVDFAIVTMAEFGVSYATSETNGHIPAIRTQIIDPTGGGDALSAAVVFALLNGISEDEAVRLGVAAASLTLRHRGAVLPELSLERLYDHLN